MDKASQDPGDSGAERHLPAVIPQQATGEYSTAASTEMPFEHRRRRFASAAKGLWTIPDRIAHGNEQISQRNYDKSAENVRARWLVYENAENYQDPVDAALLLLRNKEIITPDMTCLDVGTADGKSLSDLNKAFKGWSGSLFGLELNSEQYKRSRYWLPLYKKSSNPTAEWYTNVADTAEGKQHPKRARFIEGSITRIPFPDNSVDLTTAYYMLYDVKKPAERKQAIAELHRVTASNGICMVSTSGETNKSGHRMLEQKIAQKIAEETGQIIKAPPIMNSPFTTEIAKRELQSEFESVIMIEYNGRFVVDTIEKYNIYRGSLLSMRNQLEPVPTEDVFLRAVDEILQDVWERVEGDDPYVDSLSRTDFICSDKPLELGPDMISLAAQTGLVIQQLSLE